MLLHLAVFAFCAILAFQLGKEGFEPKITSMAFGLAGMGLLHMSDMLKYRFDSEYLWVETGENSSYGEAEGLRFRSQGRDYVVKSDAKGMLRYKGSLAVPHGARYHGENPPHIEGGNDSGGEVWPYAK